MNQEVGVAAGVGGNHNKKQKTNHLLDNLN